MVKYLYIGIGVLRRKIGNWMKNKQAGMLFMFIEVTIFVQLKT